MHTDLHSGGGFFTFKIDPLPSAFRETFIYTAITKYQCYYLCPLFLVLFLSYTFISKVLSPGNSQPVVITVSTKLSSFPTPHFLMLL